MECASRRYGQEGRMYGVIRQLGRGELAAEYLPEESEGVA
jgi:hypothetical protein